MQATRAEAIPKPLLLQREAQVFRWVLLASLAFRLACACWLLDAEADSYSHFSIARRLAAGTSWIGLHWVWLPLFHWLCVPIAAVGGTLLTVRIFNIALSGLICLLFVNLQASSPLRYRAGMVLTLCGLFSALSSSATTEVVFLAFVLAGLTCLRSLQHWYGFLGASLSLTALCLLRYEGWLLAGLFTIQCLATRRYKPLGLLILPAVCVVLWLWHRWGLTPLALLSGTQGFVRTKLGAQRLWLAPLYLLYFPVGIALVSLGPALVFVRTLPKVSRPIIWSAVGYLLFLAVTLVTRTNLGLIRHLYLLSPLYAVMLAQTRLSVRSLVIMVGGYGICFSLALGVIASFKFAPEVRVADWLAHHALSSIRCEEPVVEVLSGLPIERFAAPDNPVAVYDRVTRTRAANARFEASASGFAFTRWLNLPADFFGERVLRVVRIE